MTKEEEIALLENKIAIILPKILLAMDSRNLKKVNWLEQEHNEHVTRLHKLKNKQ